MATGIKIPLRNVDLKCEDCLSGSQPHKHAKFQQELLDYAPGELIASDIDTMPVRSREGYKYFVSFIDVPSRMAWVFPLKNRNMETIFARYESVVKLIKTQTKRNIRAFRSDNEFMNHYFKDFHNKTGTHHTRKTTTESLKGTTAQS